MIAKLTGLVDLKGEGWAIIDVSGVGYLVFCSSKILKSEIININAVYYLMLTQKCI